MGSVREKAKKKAINGKEAFVLATKSHKKYLLHFSKDDLDDAINYYAEAIKKTPENAQTYYRLASLLHETGQITPEGAIERCRQAIKIDPNNSDAHVYLGYFYMLTGDKEEADSEFKEAIKLNPKNSVSARLFMAFTIFENSSKNAKIKDFVKALYCLFSGSALMFINKAGLKMIAENIFNDINYKRIILLGGIFEKVKNDKKAYQLYTDALDTTKNPTLFYKKMANIAIRKGNYEVARQCLQNTLITSPKDLDCAVNFVEFLRKYFPQNHDELIEYYNYILGINPKNSRCYYELGHLYLKKDEYLHALNAFKYALELESDNPFYQNSLAFTYVQLEQYDDAIELYKKALETNPDNEWSSVVAQALAAIYYQIKENYEAALSMLQGALLLTKKKAPIYQTMGDVAQDRGDLEEAINYYKLSLEYDRGNSRSYSRLAMVYWESDKIEKAIANYEKAINIDPNYSIAYNNLGVVYLDGLRSPERSLAYFENASDINPEYTLAYFNAGRALEAMGENVKAANQYQLAIDLNKRTLEIDPKIIEERLFQLFNI